MSPLVHLQIPHHLMKRAGLTVMKLIGFGSRLQLQSHVLAPDLYKDDRTSLICVEVVACSTSWLWEKVDVAWALCSFAISVAVDTTCCDVSSGWFSPWASLLEAFYRWSDFSFYFSNGIVMFNRLLVCLLASGKCTNLPRGKLHMYIKLILFKW